jgi:hypothetical protein
MAKWSYAVLDDDDIAAAWDFAHDICLPEDEDTILISAPSFVSELITVYDMPKAEFPTDLSGLCPAQQEMLQYPGISEEYKLFVIDFMCGVALSMNVDGVLGQMTAAILDDHVPENLMDAFEAVQWPWDRQWYDFPCVGCRSRYNVLERAFIAHKPNALRTLLRRGATGLTHEYVTSAVAYMLDCASTPALIATLEVLVEAGLLRTLSFSQLHKWNRRIFHHRDDYSDDCRTWAPVQILKAHPNVVATNIPRSNQYKPEDEPLVNMLWASHTVRFAWISAVVA